ncbi:MAG: hypothetical protein P1V51_12585 [Deltaproteobacteria bacterium]|nr:hypothetical protein [Deltaproteobacteria bacterium]
MRWGAFGLSALLIAACSGNGNQNVGSKEDAFEGTDIKADCFDCDPADLASAYEQAELGRTGFLRTGHTWQVAYQFRADRRLERRDVGPDEAVNAGALGDLFLLDYRVGGLERRVIGDYKRSVARIEIQQASEAGPYAGLVAPERLDTFTYQVDLLMDDLFRGVAKVYYDRNFPHGRYVEMGEGSRVRAAMDPFPVEVPNVTVEGRDTRSLPALSAELTAVANKAAELGRLPADWQTRSYRYFKFDLEGGVEEVYWASGDLWPSFVTGARGDALLVWQLEP